MSLQTLENEILKGVSDAADEAALEALRVSALGKKGAISERMKLLGRMPPEERKAEGARLNLLKDKIGAAISAYKRAISRKRRSPTAGRRCRRRHSRHASRARRSTSRCPFARSAREPSIR